MDWSFSTSASMMLRAVSDPAQKNGGDSHHPICSTLGTTSSVSSRHVIDPSSGGRTKQKFHAFITSTTSRQIHLRHPVLRKQTDCLDHDCLPYAPQGIWGMILVVPWLPAVLLDLWYHWQTKGILGRWGAGCRINPVWLERVCCCVGYRQLERLWESLVDWLPFVSS